MFAIAASKALVGSLTIAGAAVRVGEARYARRGHCARIARAQKTRSAAQLYR